ncbi:DUF4862 family protein [Azospirillum picis]|uniref:DUF4862 family protein n=1 Tax=Azospirillum picis TaxID=488438 RepID=A0ABU0MSB2_9PROT|nr:DUF4862 family protein [Azospirillum picis]MBP2302686.1 hypothetical protein [Azospirillum picis]MDQ0536347.1 hypothetical protein [Azospirillum picis]
MTPRFHRKAVRIVGAYAAQPDALEERGAFLEEVLSLPGVDGLEIPWGAPGWERDAPILADVLGAVKGRGGHVLTLIGAAASAAAKEPAVGLASPDPEGRDQAVQLVAAARGAALDFMARGQRIAAVELQAFPTLPQADAGQGGRALERSLCEILSWDWGGATVVLEHCDARRTGRWQKGLLPLDIEIEAVAAAAATSPTPTGMVVNWGRSAIEERDAAAPRRHVQSLRFAGLLRGLIFSGATDRDGAYGMAWSDVHPPLKELAPDSVMDQDHVAATLEAAGSTLLYDGVKVAARPPQTTMKDRLALIRGTLAALDVDQV